MQMLSFLFRTLANALCVVRQAPFPKGIHVVHTNRTSQVVSGSVALRRSHAFDIALALALSVEVAF